MIKDWRIMEKGRKFVATAVFNAIFVAISVLGFVSCEPKDEKNVPKSFVCSETNLTIELSEDKSYYIVTDCPVDKTEVVIPENYYGKPVKEIAATAFDGCENLTKVSIPDCMIDIKLETLVACKNLEYTEKGGVKYLGNESNPYVYLAKYFSEEMETVVVESGCKAIGHSAFSDCDKLTSVSLPDGLTSIGGAAFRYCKFTNIKLPASLKNIGVSAFSYCQNLNNITIPEYVTEINERTFEGCYQLGNVRFRNNLTKIGAFAFSETALTRITIPYGVKTIGGYAFAGCGDLTSVTIPTSVTDIGPNTFFYCSSLRRIQFDGTKEQWGKVRKGLMWDFSVSAEVVSCMDGTVNLSTNY